MFFPSFFAQFNFMNYRSIQTAEIPFKIAEMVSNIVLLIYKSTTSRTSLFTDYVLGEGIIATVRSPDKFCKPYKVAHFGICLRNPRPRVLTSTLGMDHSSYFWELTSRELLLHNCSVLNPLAPNQFVQCPPSPIYYSYLSLVLKALPLQSPSTWPSFSNTNDFRED